MVDNRARTGAEAPPKAPSEQSGGQKFLTSPEKAPSSQLLSWKFWRGPPESILARATVVLAMATIILAVMAAIQIYILAVTDKSTRKAANAAEISANTAQLALLTARESVHIEQQPVIWLTGTLGQPQFVLSQKGDNTGQIIWEWNLTNYGKTAPVGCFLITT
jgi:hypothetical protein